MDSLFLGLRVVVSLAAVLGLLWVIQKKVSTKTGRGGASKAKHVTVVARQGIAGKASVAVVDVEGVRYVLGVTESQVSVLGSGLAPADATVTPIAAAATAASTPELLAAPVSPIDAAPVSPVDAVPVSPIDAAPVSPIDAAPVSPIDFAAALERAQATAEPADDEPTYAPVFAADHRNARRAPVTQYRRTGGAVPALPTSRRAARARVVAPEQTSPLAGSILSASTWKQAAAAMRSQRRA